MIDKAFRHVKNVWKTLISTDYWPVLRRQGRGFRPGWPVIPDRPDPLMQTKMSQKWEEKTHFCQVFKPNIHSPGKGVLFFFWTKLLFGIKPFLRMSGVPRVVEGLRVIQHENTKFHWVPCPSTIFVPPRPSCRICLYIVFTWHYWVHLKRTGFN